VNLKSFLKKEKIPNTEEIKPITSQISMFKYTNFWQVLAVFHKAHLIGLPGKL